MEDINEEEEKDCGCQKRRMASSDKTGTEPSTSAGISKMRDKISTFHRSFKGKKALVVGGTKGIGKSIATNLHHLGADVTVIGKRSSEVDFRVEGIQNIEVIEMDISWWTLTEKKLEFMDQIDFLVNCAGITPLVSILNTTEELVDQTLNINVKGMINITRIVANIMIKRKTGGSIVTITSQSSSFGIRKHGLFGASKAAVEAFTRAAALELAPHKIRVNCVSPTVVLTNVSKRFWANPKESKPFLAKIPMKQFAEVKDVVQAVLFLLSDRASMVTAYCLPIDGGFSAC